MLTIPLDVPTSKKSLFQKNYKLITQNSDKLFLFAGDQKLEHLNSDFYGSNIHNDDADPEHLFKIANKGKVGVFATQFGLLSRYAHKYKSVPYLVKLNGKTNIIKTSQKDPYSSLLATVDQVAEFSKNNKLKIAGVGYTLYIGSKYEAEMISQAAWIINEAHKNGLLAVIWIYPRGKAVKNEKSIDMIAGATGSAVCLGADFVKVNYPKAKPGQSSAELLKQAITAAGNTGVICAGGSSRGEKEFLQDIHDQINISGAKGVAIGRNIHQKSLSEAVKLCKAIKCIVNQEKSVSQASK